MNKLNKFKICGEVDTTITGKLLYLVLDEISDKNGEITIAQRKISDALNISQATVSRNLRRLQDNNYIDIYAQYNRDGGRSVNRYVVRGN